MHWALFWTSLLYLESDVKVYLELDLKLLWAIYLLKLLKDSLVTPSSSGWSSYLAHGPKDVDERTTEDRDHQYHGCLGICVDYVKLRRSNTNLTKWKVTFSLNHKRDWTEVDVMSVSEERALCVIILSFVTPNKKYFEIVCSGHLIYRSRHHQGTGVLGSWVWDACSLVKLSQMGQCTRRFALNPYRVTCDAFAQGA